MILLSRMLKAEAYYQIGWGLILQAETMQGLSNEERMAKYAAAEKALLRSVWLNPKNPKAWEALSLAQLELGKYATASKVGWIWRQRAFKAAAGARDCAAD